MSQTLENTPASWTERAALACQLEAVGWSGKGQEDRFRAVLAAVAPRAGETLLDFGCGTGALSERLPDGVAYLGVDWAAGMVRRARNDHPERSFSTKLPPSTFDVVACIGPFNLPNAWSKAQTWQTLRDLWERCTRALAVSLYAGKDERCLRYEPGQVLSFAASVAPRWRVEFHRHNDLLMVMWR